MDNADLAELTVELLERWGHDVRLARNGAAALEVACETRPEILLLDIGLPGMNGYELARQLRKMPSLAEASFIALTGFGSEADRREGVEAGFDAHLTKPVAEEQLQELCQAPPHNGHDRHRQEASQPERRG